MSGNYTVVVDGKKYSVQVAEGNVDIKIQESASVASQAVSGTNGATEVKSQTPGNVWKINVKVGDSVKEGDVLMILEAMKMEIEVHAPKSGVVASLNVNPNDAVADGQLLATME
jgi:pyruvate carboxylase subunit B